MIAPELARINFRRADEMVRSRHSSPTNATFMRAGDVDPRSKRGGPAKCDPRSTGGLGDGGWSERAVSR